MIIAITGNIGSGKSVVAKHLARMSGALYSDTDAVCRDLLQKGQPGWSEAMKRLGKEFFKDDGTIDRSRLRTAVFEDDNLRAELEDILHPLVRDHVNNLIYSIKDTNQPLVVEVPLLFEVGWQSDFDYVITVSAPAERAIERVVERDEVSASEVEKVMSTQLDLEKKAQYSDFVIDNSGELDKTLAQIEFVMDKLSLSRQPGQA